jgi:hypothetical protein
MASSAWTEMVADSDMSTSGSRRVRYAVLPRRGATDDLALDPHRRHLVDVLADLDR